MLRFILECALVVLILFVTDLSIFPQKPKVFPGINGELIARYEFSPAIKYDESHYTDETLSYALSIYQNAKGSFAIRLCSDAPFFESFGKGSIHPRLIINRLTYKPKDNSTDIVPIPPEKIMILRSPDCISKKNLDKRIAVELWWIPDNVKFNIPTIENYKVCQIKSIYENTDKFTQLEFENYVREFAEKLKPITNRQMGRGYLGAVYYQKLTPKLKNNFELAKKILADKIKVGILKVELRKEKIGNFQKSGKKVLEKKYPLIQATIITPECSSQSNHRSLGKSFPRNSEREKEKWVIINR